MGSYLGQSRWCGQVNRFFRASEIIGSTVINREGEEVGAIEDIILDEVGRLEYAVLSFRGLFETRVRLIAVPWQAVRVEADGHQFVLDVPREMLENAPGFDRDNWPEASDPEWRRQISNHYGVQPIQVRTGADIESGTNPSDTERQKPAAPHRRSDARKAA